MSMISRCRTLLFIGIILGVVGFGCKDDKTPITNNTDGISKNKTGADKSSKLDQLAAKKNMENTSAGVANEKKTIGAIPSSGNSTRAGTSRIGIGDDYRPFKAKTYDGKEINLDDYKGKYILLDFWATWCRPCMMEMPNITKISEKYKDNSEFAFIGISLDKDIEAVKQSVVKFNMNYPNVFDGKMWRSDIVQQYGVNAIPFTVLIGKDGRVLKTGLRGEQLVAELDKLLASKS